MGCWPVPTDNGAGLAGKSLMTWWLVGVEETIQLRSGDGEMILTGLTHPVTAGQTIEATFKFAHAAPVTVAVPVVTAPAAN